MSAESQQTDTRNNRIAVGSGVLCTVKADSYIMQQQTNCWKRCFLWGPVLRLQNEDHLLLKERERS
jgi:hypothetical protein